MQPWEAIDAKKKHPFAWWSLLVSTLIPMVVGITALGALLKRLFPSPTALPIVAGACVFILAIPPLICFGAAAWLLVARRIVPRPVSKAFFIQPGLGIFSRVSEWMLVRAYGKDD